MSTCLRRRAQGIQGTRGGRQGPGGAARGRPDPSGGTYYISSSVNKVGDSEIDKTSSRDAPDPDHQAPVRAAQGALLHIYNLSNKRLKCFTIYYSVFGDDLVDDGHSVGAAVAALLHPLELTLEQYVRVRGWGHLASDELLPEDRRPPVGDLEPEITLHHGKIALDDDACLHVNLLDGGSLSRAIQAPLKQICRLAVVAATPDTLHVKWN